MQAGHRSNFPTKSLEPGSNVRRFLGEKFVIIRDIIAQFVVSPQCCGNTGVGVENQIDAATVMKLIRAHGPIDQGHARRKGELT
jgi:hypothetical protein